jgi:predicted RNase H-like HicB family nuclease
MQLKMKMELPVEVTKDDGWFISSCHVLDIHSQGKTENKALENIAEALELFLLSCFERGTLVEVLKESGFKPQQKAVPATKKTDRSRLLDIGIPFNFKPSRSVCHV